MKSHPIAFTGPMVRAILDGRKTMTRRVVNGVPSSCDLDPYFGSGTLERYDAVWHVEDKSSQRYAKNCPFGAPGDHLWVKESWCRRWDDQDGFAYNSEGNPDSSCCWYQADGTEVVATDGDGFQRWNKDGSAASPWTSPRFMPRWASRITLEITEIRVERVRDIMPADIREEGVEFDTTAEAFENWAELWDRVNGSGAWARNDWVWVIRFEVVK